LSKACWQVSAIVCGASVRSKDEAASEFVQSDAIGPPIFNSNRNP